ncbi:MAG: acyl-CoA thioester hydrolase/BAAT C-terminal domain-containing protein [Pseudomonas sp.]|nr:acyl-CoA thioester hydrolase/BAAT C-terminal domain-containing protein [Pseudomonas sp.]
MIKARYLLPAVVLFSTTVAAQTLPFTPVDSTEFVAEYFAGSKTGYGILLVEGAAGGMPDLLAQKIAALGYPVLSVAYFKEPGLPQHLENLPLEYLEQPKQWLLKQAETRNDGLIMVGWSKGAELTLNTIARDPDYKAAIAIAPTSVVWQGRGDAKTPVSSWSYQQQPVPFLTWPKAQAEQTINQAVLQTLENANWKTHPARIPVENIKAPLLLLSGGQDSIWPATQMAQQICQQMQQIPSSNCTHIDYPEAGHLLNEQRMMGGSSEANAQANNASQEVIQAFLERVNN